MKKIFVLLVIAAAMLVNACSQAKGAYVDLRSGKKIEIEKGPVTGAWVNAETKEPVYIYVDTDKHDTIYGKTGAVINGHVVKNGDVYMYDDDMVGWDDKIQEESKYKTDNSKEKVDKDGDIKIKTE